MTTRWKPPRALLRPSPAGGSLALALAPGRTRSYNRGMSGWRCPHCGSPQMETSRCWVCHRSTTTCISCRQYRRAVAGRLGYCALDKHRTPLHGDEERACWVPSIVEPVVAPGSESGMAPAPTRVSAPSRQAAPAAGMDLWGTPIATETAPDRAARGGGMWTESDSIRDPKPQQHQHGSSIRSTPWGRVPGLRDEAVWRKGIKPAGGRGR